MINYEVQIDVLVLADPEDTRPMEEFVAAVREHLEHDLATPAQTTVGHESDLYVYWMTVAASSPVEAAVNASTLLRTAAHACGVRTPGWPDDDAVRVSDWASRIIEKSVEAHEAKQGVLVG